MSQQPNDQEQAEMAKYTAGVEGEDFEVAPDQTPGGDVK
jgi:hypothetical protein